MRIAFIGQKGIPARQGGVETHVENLSYRLADRGHDVFVYSRPQFFNERIYYRGITRVKAYSIQTKNLDAITHALFSTIHAIFSGYDVIHYHGVGPSLLAWIPRIFAPKTRVVATFHCRDRFHKKWSWFARLMLSAGEWASVHFPHETIVVSKSLREFVWQKYHRRATYIPNGCAILETNREDVLPVFGIESKKYILAVSRLVKHKGVHVLIDAFSKLDRDDLKLVIVGDTSFTDEYVAELKEQASGVDNVVFAGFQTGEELAQLYHNALVFVHPSEAEGLPINVLEALRHGLPSILSNIKENLEASGGYAYFFEKGNSDDLERQLRRVLRRIRIAEGVARAGQKYIQVTYDWDAISLSIEELYHSMKCDQVYDVNERVAYRPQR